VAKETRGREAVEVKGGDYKGRRRGEGGGRRRGERQKGRDVKGMGKSRENGCEEGG